MKSKKSLLFLFMAIVMLASCLMGVFALGASAEPAAQSSEKVTTYVVKNSTSYPAIGYSADKYRFAEGTEFKKYEGTDYYAFRNVRSAMVYASGREGGWAADESVTILIDDNKATLGRLKVHYGAPGTYDGTILRADGTPLPVTIMPYGSRTQVEIEFQRTDSVTGSAILCNHFIFKNIKFVGTSRVQLQVAATTEFYNCEFDLQSLYQYSKAEGSSSYTVQGPATGTYALPSTIQANPRQSNGYGMTMTTESVFMKGDHTKRLDANGEYTATIIFSGNTKVPSNMEVHGLGYVSDTFSSLKIWNGQEASATALPTSKINGRIIVKDNAQILGKLIGKVDSAKSGVQLGKAYIDIMDNAKVNELIGASTGVFADTSVTVNVKNGTIGKISGITAGTQAGTVAITVENGVVEGAVKDVVGGTADGKVSVTLMGGTYKGNVSGVTLGSAVAGAALTIQGNGTIAAKGIASTATVTKADPWGSVETVYVKIPVADKAKLTVVNGAGVTNKPYIIDSGYEVRGEFVPQAAISFDERINVKFLFSKAAVDVVGTDAFTYKFTLGTSTVLAEGKVVSSQTLTSGGVTYYWVALPQLGAGDFVTEITCTVTGLEDQKTSLKAITQNGVNLYAATTTEGKLFRALMDYGNAACGANALEYYNAQNIVKTDLPANLGANAVTGASINLTGKTLLMGTAPAIRFTAATPASVAGASLKINGVAIAPENVVIDTTAGTISFYIHAAFLNEALSIEIYDAQGNLCAAVNESVKSIAIQLLDADANNLKAQAMLALIQEIQNYRA